MERLPVQAEPGERVTARRTLEVRDPRNWWPWGLGEQYRYTVRAKLDGHETTATTGFCDVDRDGGRLQVNGEPVSLRGFSVLPSDDPVADVEAAREGNANVLRAYGHVPRRAFHEACDEAGLLVWQDLPLVGPGGFDVDRGRTLATALVEAYGQHPSVATYGVHADPFDPFPEPLGAGRMARLRVRWRVWRAAADREPAERVAEAFPENALALPVSGKPGTSPDAASLYPGWDFGTPGDVEWLLDRYPSLGGLVGGFGAAALTGDVDERSETFDWARHDARVGNDDPGASQAYQARLLETVATALRRRGTSLQVADCLRDTHRAGGRGVLTVDGDRKPGFESLANAFEPVQAILEGPPGEADGVVVCNDSRTPVEGTLRWSTAPTDEIPDGTTGVSAPEDGSAGVTVPAGGRTRVDAVELPDDGTIQLELETDAKRVHNEYHF
jgi:beta-mannosidase